MQYIITAYDGTDEQAIDRRLMARDEHLKSVEKESKMDSIYMGQQFLIMMVK